MTVQFSRSVVSDSLWPHELQHTRPPCPSPLPRVPPNPCPLSWWYHSTISSSVSPFSSCPQSFPASRSFPTSQLFTSAGQSIGVSASVLPMNTQDWSPLGWTGWTHCKHYPQWWKIESIFPKVRNKTMVPTLTTSIQHSSGSFSHSNQRRKRNKRNPNWKRRSKTLSLQVTWSST